jgi:hypothetical protein
VLHVAIRSGTGRPAAVLVAIAILVAVARLSLHAVDGAGRALEVVSSLLAGAALVLVAVHTGWAMRPWRTPLREAPAWEVDGALLPGWGQRQAKLFALLRDLGGPSSRWLEDIVWTAQRGAEQAARMAWIAPSDAVCMAALRRIALLGQQADGAIRSFLARAGIEGPDDGELMAVVSALRESLEGGERIVSGVQPPGP